INGDAFAAENFFQLAGRVEVKFVEDMRAALDEGNLHAEPGEELRELDGDRPAAQDDQRARQPLQLQGRVAVQAAEIIEAAERRRRNARTGGEDEMPGGQFLSIAQFQQVRAGEAGLRADESEAPAAQLL